MNFRIEERDILDYLFKKKNNTLESSIKLASPLEAKANLKTIQRLLKLHNKSSVNRFKQVVNDTAHGGAKGLAVGVPAGLSLGLTMSVYCSQFIRKEFYGRDYECHLDEIAILTKYLMLITMSGGAVLGGTLCGSVGAAIAGANSFFSMNIKLTQMQIESLVKLEELAERKISGSIEYPVFAENETRVNSR